MTDTPDTDGVPRRGSPLLQAVGRAGLRLARWRIVGTLPHLRKFVIIVAPHTSNLDFLVGVLAMFALDLEVHWLGKDSLFSTPAGSILRRLGGRPVRRDLREGIVAEIAATIRAEPGFLLALAPEGTRRRVSAWRTGYYHIAVAAGVPIVPVWLDWGRREVGIGAPMIASGALERDVSALQALYRPEMARHPAGFRAAPSVDVRSSASQRPSG